MLWRPNWSREKPGAFGSSNDVLWKNKFVTFSVCFFCVLCYLKDTVLAGVSRRFRVARPIRTDRCLRRTLRLVIRPRSVASVSGAGTLTSCRGAIGLLPRQVHGRIRCRGRWRAVGHHHHGRWAWPWLWKVIAVDGNHLARRQMNRRAVLRMLFPPRSRLVPVRL